MSEAPQLEARPCRHRQPDWFNLAVRLLHQLAVPYTTVRWTPSTVPFWETITALIGWTYISVPS